MVYKTSGEERLLTGHTGRMFLILTFMLLCLKISQRLLPPLVPAIIEDFGISAFLAGIVLTALRVAEASMEYPSGRFADQLSRTTVLLVCLLIVILGVATISFSIGYVSFLVGVVVFGMGLGLHNSAARALLSDMFQEKRGRSFGLYMIGSDLSGIFAAGMAIWITAVAAWRNAFLPLLLVIIPLPLIIYVVSREPIRFTAVDFEMRKTVTRLFEDPSMRWLVIMYSLFVIASSGVTSFLPTFLIQIHGFSFASASLMFALIYAIGIVSKPMSGVMSDWFPRPVVAGVSLFLAVGGIAVLIFAPFQALIVGGVIVYAFGQRSAPPVLQAFLMDRFPDDTMGGDLGATRSVYLTIGSLGPGYTGVVASTLGFIPAYASLMFFLLLGGAILFWFSWFGWPTSR